LELRIGKKIISNPTEITERLNMYLISIADELVKQNINKGSCSKLHQEIKHCPNSMFIPPVTETEVVSLTKSLKGKPAAGFEDIPEYLVKQCIQLIKEPLTYIYNVSLNSGVFPNEWKMAKVKPLYKKGDRYDIKNYRPISLISVFAKLLERLVFNVDKTEVMLFHNKHSKIPVKPKITLNKINLVYTAETKFLGIYTTGTLRWNSHVQSLATKLGTVSYMIKVLERDFESLYDTKYLFYKISIAFNVWYPILGENGG
jgi:hypothetical protein